MKKYSFLILLLTCCFSFNSCHSFTGFFKNKTAKSNNKSKICGDLLGNDYNTYLNKIVELQLDDPFPKKRKKKVFTVKIHAFLESYEARRVSFREAQSIIETLNHGFKGSNISFVRLKEISYKKLNY